MIKIGESWDVGIPPFTCKGFMDMQRDTSGFYDPMRLDLAQNIVWIKLKSPVSDNLRSLFISCYSHLS